MPRAHVVRLTLVLVATLGLCACAGSRTGDVGRAGGGSSGAYKVGAPYQVSGIWYYPKEDFGYDESGIASWYGPGFHKNATANGERFDQNELTAAHKTLPMPSLVRVTNLENGRSIVVRINDRGPFVNGRILDMSRRSAQLLGFEQQGTAKVRVTILANESRALAAAARAGTPVAADDGPPPVAAPQQTVVVEGKPPPRPATIAVPVAAVEPPAIPGKTEDGRFLPAPVVSVVPVSGPHQIYVQAGAFTVYGNAERAKSRLAGIGSARISTAQVGSTQFYRVRLGPVDTVEGADAILDQVIHAGATEAKVVVD